MPNLGEVEHHLQQLE